MTKKPLFESTEESAECRERKAFREKQIAEYEEKNKREKAIREENNEKLLAFMQDRFPEKNISQIYEGQLEVENERSYYSQNGITLKIACYTENDDDWFTEYVPLLDFILWGMSLKKALFNTGKNK